MTKKRPTEALRPERMRRILIYSALVLFLAVTQCSFFSALHICPAVPDLMLGLILAILLFDYPKAAAITALGAGYLVDALGSSFFAFSPAFYLIAVVLLAPLGGKMLSGFWSYCVLLLPALALRALYTVLCLTVRLGKLPSLSLLGGILPAEALVTALCCLLFYPFIKLCTYPIRSHNRFSF